MSTSLQPHPHQSQSLYSDLKMVTHTTYKQQDKAYNFIEDGPANQLHKSHILDLSVHEHSPGGNFSNSSRYDQRVIKNKFKPNTMRIMSEEELKIRGELESEIEGNLEDEIKDGIYHLALRLHRLYQHQKERNAKQVIGSGVHKKNKTFSEVNISIKMEEGTKIEIKEMKKETPDKGRPRTTRSENYMQPLLVSNNRKFDWAKSLRSGKGPTSIENINKSNRRSNQAKIISNKHQGFSSNSNLDNNTRRNLISSYGQRKGSSVGVENKVLELEWKC